MSETPPHLLQGNRPLDPEFLPSERLFFRIKSSQLVEGQVAPEAIRFPRFSVNREKYNRPADVLVPDWPDWGVAAFKYEDVPDKPWSAVGSPHEFTFRVEHDPLPHNYAHSELRAYRNREHSEKIDVPKTVKKAFRQELAARVVVLRVPRS
ncbi:hypothetical protein HS125_20000 [bacterium]|nr:hypothetical protein [bacterium]